MQHQQEEGNMKSGDYEEMVNSQFTNPVLLCRIQYLLSTQKQTQN